MPRPRSESSIKAEKLYNAGQRLVDIARTMGVPEGTVRRWKSTQGWDKTKVADPPTAQTERSEIGANVRKRGAPLRNQNATKHGIYSEPFADVLKGRDLEVYDGIFGTGVDEESGLNEMIAILTVRERWLLDKIQRIQSDKELLLNNVNRFERSREFDSTDDEALYHERQQKKVEAGEKLPGREVAITTTTVEGTDLLLRAHNELTRVQEQKRRCIEALNRIRQSKQETKGNTVANDWILALTGGDDVGE